MADDTTDKPLEHLSLVEKNIPPPAPPEPAPEPEAEAPDARAKLRAFENEHLGEDVPRVNGQIEKGHGSLFHQKLDDDQKRTHSALEQLVHAEDELQKANANLAKAERDHDAAAAAVANA